LGLVREESGAFRALLLFGSFVPLPSGASSQQTHEFDEAWIGGIPLLWYKRQFRLLERGGAFALLQLSIIHRIAIPSIAPR
jgi:hypothetical protein